MKRIWKIWLLVAVVFTACSANFEQKSAGKQDVVFSSADGLIFENLPKYFSNILTCAKFFIGTPYEAATLEKGNDSLALVNLQAFDCTTFVENVLAFSVLDTLTKRGFVQKLTEIRYRNGQVKGYSSRLHYFSEWIFDNEKKDFLRDITQELGGVKIEKKLDFMTRHREAYPALKNDACYAKMFEVEKNLFGRKYYIIPKKKIVEREAEIHDGDIIALATNIDGLDFVHVGFAIHQKERLHLLHASSKLGKVVVSEKNLSDYVKNWNKVVGIVVLRVEDDGKAN